MSGALCGSEFVDPHMIAWLKEKAGNFEAKCKSLGLTPTACVKKASIAFESIKHKFSPLNTDLQYVTVRRSQGAAERVWDVEMTNKEIESFFMPVTASIIRCIENQLTNKAKVSKDPTKFTTNDANFQAIMVTGGFSRSEYLINLLRNMYEKDTPILRQTNPAVGPYQPVSRGALLRYQEISPRGLTSKESFRLGQVEIWEPRRHPNATLNRTKGTIGRGMPRPNRNIVEKDPFDSNDIIYNRWVSIMKKVCNL